jgi:acyl-CoA-binding protein
VFAVKRRFELGGAAHESVVQPPSAPATVTTVAGAGGGAGPSSLDTFETPATPHSPRMSMTVSYPDKFHLALKYAAEGPPLPNLSDADRILLEALQQQATVGECNRPRPGMWDSAEEKAKYEAWKKLGAMSRAEAMHLYVQAIEVFDEHWLEWKGLQAAVAAAVGAVTPVAGNGRNGAPPKLDLDATLGSMRALRASLDRLPPVHQQTLRDECDALSRALDNLRPPPATR